MPTKEPRVDWSRFNSLLGIFVGLCWTFSLPLRSWGYILTEAIEFLQSVVINLLLEVKDLGVQKWLCQVVCNSDLKPINIFNDLHFIVKTLLHFLIT